MTKSQLQKHLQKVKNYLQSRGISAANNGKEITFQVGEGPVHRVTSVYAAKRLLNKCGHSVRGRG